MSYRVGQTLVESDGGTSGKGVLQCYESRRIDYIVPSVIRGFVEVIALIECTMERGFKNEDINSTAGSNVHLVGVAPERMRIWKEFIHNRTRGEKLLAALLGVLFVLTLALLISLIITANKQPNAVCYSSQCIKTASMLLDSMDTRFDPCDDFFKFACGRWPESHFSQGGSNSWFSDRTNYLSAKIESIVHVLLWQVIFAGFLSDNVTSKDPLPLAQAKALYSTCLDTDKMDELGLEPMLSVLESAGLPRTLPDESSATTFSIAKALAKVQRTLNMDILLQLSMIVNPKTNLTVMVVSPTVGGSSLPELVSSEQRVSVSAREALSLRLAYMTGVLSIIHPNANATELGTAALKILVVDSQIRSDIQKSEAEEVPKLMTYSELQEMMDNTNETGPPKLRFNWVEFLTVLLEGVGKEVTSQDMVYVDSPSYFVLLANRLHRARPETFQRYLWWFLVTSMVPHSNSELRSLKDELYEALFRRPRQTRAQKCVKYVRIFYNMAIAYKFASWDNLVETTRKVTSMLRDITISFGHLVDSLSWMDVATKRNASKKAKAIESYIGYPDRLLVPGHLEDLYKGMEVIDGQFLLSMVSLRSVEVKKILKTLGSPPNETNGWFGDPLDVNAFYARASNAITIPAGILQPPFYFLGLESLNYGAIGSILGHELTHAFDVEGKDYDESGQKVSWWDNEMTQAYDERALCFVNQYDKFTAYDKYKLNGTLTLAENIADNGGLREAFQAYEHYLERSGEEPQLPGLEKYTSHQLFFLAFANVWCEKADREDSANEFSDVHSPNRFRVLGTLRNVNAFSRTWRCPSGSKMNPRDKCVLW